MLAQPDMKRRVDPRRLRAGEWVAGISGAALLGVMFLDWYGARPAGEVAPYAPLPAGPGSARDAWEAFGALDALLLLAGLTAVGLAAVTATERTAAVPVATAALTALVGILATVLVLVRVLVLPDMPLASGIPGAGDLDETTRSPGLYLGLAACLGVAVGGWLGMHDERSGRPGGEAEPG